MQIRSYGRSSSRHTSGSREGRGGRKREEGREGERTNARGSHLERRKGAERMR